MIEEETSPKDTIERFQKLVQQEKVDCVQGIISTGVGLALGPVVEEARALTIFWDGTTQDGVEEKLPNPKYLFRSTDNECEAVMSSLLAIKHWKGQFKRVAGINPDYSYGRNNMAAFVALLKRFNIEHEVVTEQWPKVGTMELTSHVAALKAAKPDLIFSSLLFADLPVFMKQAHAAELTKGTKLVFPAAGWQHTLMKKDFTPEGMLFGHNTLYFDNPNATPMAKEFVAWYADRAQGLSRTGRPIAPTSPSPPTRRRWRRPPRRRAAVAGSRRRRSARWKGLSVESLGGKGSWRKDHIADQTFVQGFTTHNNKYDFVTLDPPGSRPCIPPTCRSRAGAEFLGVAEDRAVQGVDGPARRHMSGFANILLGGIFHAAVLFLVAAGLQLVFGVQKIVNLACGSFYALGAYFGITFVNLALNAGLPAWLLLPVLIVAGLLMAVVGPPIERLLRTVYDRDESFQLLLTFALVLMFQDVLRFIWGANPQSLSNVLTGLRQGDWRRLQRAGLQSAGDRRRDRRGVPDRALPAAHQLRPPAARDGREPHHGGGARRRRAQRLRRRVHARHGARHDRRGAGGADLGGLARHGHRVRDRGLRRGGDRRARLHARRARRRAARRPDPRRCRWSSIPSSRCSRST